MYNHISNTVEAFIQRQSYWIDSILETAGMFTSHRLFSVFCQWRFTDL